MFGVIILQCESCHNMCTCNLIKNSKLCFQCRKHHYKKRVSEQWIKKTILGTNISKSMPKIKDGQKKQV